jgi:succinate dehydrogenase / fumarate reductase membrane anchor subunit
MNKNFKQTSKTGSLAWLLQRISAVILFVLLLLHFITYHFLTQGRTTTYQYVLARAQSWWFPLLQFMFLLTALYHGLNGVWSVLEDYTASKFWRLIWYSLLLTVGTILLFVGTLTIIKLYTLKIA